MNIQKPTLEQAETSKPFKSQAMVYKVAYQNLIQFACVHDLQPIVREDHSIFFFFPHRAYTVLTALDGNKIYIK